VSRRRKSSGEKKKGAPAYMVSFGDMMTLILCFFILLVSMSEERKAGLLAKGVGSFVVALETHGLDGILSGKEKEEIFEHVRRRFNLPPEEDEERRESHLEASKFELLQARALEALEPHKEVRQPQVATFQPDSAALTNETRTYLDRLAGTLRPGPGQVLQLEGHALDAGTRFRKDNQWLAFSRAEEVRQYLIREHRFKPDRVQARAWFEEVTSASEATRSVDARLIIPSKDKSE